MKKIELNKEELERVLNGLHRRVEYMKKEQEIYPSAGGLGENYYNEEIKQTYRLLGKLIASL